MQLMRLSSDSVCLQHITEIELKTYTHPYMMLSYHVTITDSKVRAAWDRLKWACSYYTGWCLPPPTLAAVPFAPPQLSLALRASLGSTCVCTLQMFAAAIALPTSIAVLMLLVWHIRMVAQNKTTIEHAEVRRQLQLQQLTLRGPAAALAMSYGASSVQSLEKTSNR